MAFESNFPPWGSLWMSKYQPTCALRSLIPLRCRTPILGQTIEKCINFTWALFVTSAGLKSVSWEREGGGYSIYHWVGLYKGCKKENYWNCHLVKRCFLQLPKAEVHWTRQQTIPNYTRDIQTLTILLVGMVREPLLPVTFCVLEMQFQENFSILTQLPDISVHLN